MSTSTPTNATPTNPVNTPPTGTIDITNIVESLRQTFVTWGTQFVTTSVIAVPYLAWLKLPVISQLFGFVVSKILNAVSLGLEMEGFFMNTAIRKASQAQDFIDAVNSKNSLPATATSEEIENAEKNQMAAFRNFVMVTN